MSYKSHISFQTEIALGPHGAPVLSPAALESKKDTGVTPPLLGLRLEMNFNPDQVGMQRHSSKGVHEKLPWSPATASLSAAVTFLRKILVTVNVDSLGRGMC